MYSVLVPYIRIGLSRGEKCLILCEEAGGEAKAREVISRVFDGESFFNLEWGHRTAAGDTRWILSNVFPYSVNGKDVEMGISVNVDITERLRLE